ncbi:MAG: NAD(P)H-dependent oxidoreductase [Candidatus Brocadiaceae bacterium]|jgi:NAD(P)H dehydrogenase (quinone)
MGRSKIAVIYHSQSQGNTRAAAELVAEGAKGAGGFDVFLANTDEERVDPALLAACAGVAFGTPDYFSYPAGGMKTFMDDWLIARRGGNEEIEGMPVALFMTHGGGGAAKEPFEELFQRVGSQVGETLAMKGRPGDEDAEKCRKLGELLAREAGKYAAQED